jgi:PAS domain S-box-containing protein
MTAPEEGSMKEESKTPTLPENTSISWYQALVDNMNEGFGIIDETGVFTYVNKRFGDLLGYAPNEMIGHSIFDFLDESQADILRSTLEKRRHGISSQYELAWTTSCGNKIPTLVSGAPLFNKEEHHIGSFAAITDISELKENQEEIRRSREIYRTLFEESPIGIIRLNANGDILDANKTALEILGYGSKQGHLDININQHPKLSESEINRQYQKALTEKESFTGRTEYKTTAGKKLYVRYKLHPIIDESGKVSEIIAAFDDISALRSSDLALRASEEKYRTLAESSLQGLTIIQDDRYVYINRAFADMLGYSVDEILSMTKEKQWGLIHPDDQEYLLKLSEDRKLGKAVPQPYQYRFM